MGEVQEFSDSGPRRQKWVLTKEALDALLGSLDPNPDLAGEKYLLIRRNLVRFFEGRRCQFAEDHADEAINRVAKRLAEGEEIRDFNGYSYGVARLLLLEILKDRAREERALKELPALRLVHGDPADDDREQDRLECLTRCLEGLPAEGRKLIVRYYQGDKQARIENRKKLGAEMRIPNQALRSRAVRLREKLEGCLSTCMVKKSSATQLHGFSH